MDNIVSYDLHKKYYLKNGVYELALGGAAVASAVSLPFPSTLAIASSALPFAFGIRFILKYIDTSDQRKQLNEGNFFNVRLADIQSFRNEALSKKKTVSEKVLQQKREDNYYVGSGFTFTPRHMAIYEKIKNDHRFHTKGGFENVAGGLPFIHNLGKAEETPQLLNLKEHTLVAGESGSGKTVFLKQIGAQMIMDGEAVVIIDPKGDRGLLNAVYDLCRKCGRQRDFRFFSLAHPGNSIAFDPMGNSMKSNDAANRITSIMGLEGQGKTFQDFCWNVLNSVCESLINANKKLNLKNIHKYSLVRMKELFGENAEYLSSLTDEQQRKALNDSQMRLNIHVQHPGEHFSKMITSLEPVLTSLATGEAGQLLNPEEKGLSWAEIVNEKRVVYFNLSSLIDSYTPSSVSKLIVQDLISYLGQILAYDKPKRVKLICDEFYSLVYKGFGDALNKSREAGLQAFLGLQTDADIAAQLDRDMVDVMLGNVPNKVYMRISIEELAKGFTKGLSEVDYIKVTKMRSTNSTPNEKGLFFRSGSTERLETVKQTVVTPEMIKSLPQGQAFIYNKGMQPIKVAIPMIADDLESDFFKEVLNRTFAISDDELADTPAQWLYPAQPYGQAHE
jgi:conjugal transfer pilus assembly protein TraD